MSPEAPGLTVRELTLRATVPLVINTFNQLTYLRGMVEQFRAAGFRNLVVIDNGSRWPPLLAYLDQLARSGEAIVIYYGENRGPHHFFLQGLYRHLFDAAPLLYSDPDLRLRSIAPDFLSRLLDISHQYRCCKVGSALTVPDAAGMKPGLVFRHPDGSEHALVDWERQFWQHPLGDGLYNAPIDTTLHLFNPAYYRPGDPLITGIRVAGDGFEARHLPWFADDPMPADELAHYRSLSRHSSW